MLARDQKIRLNTGALAAKAVCHLRHGTRFWAPVLVALIASPNVFLPTMVCQAAKPDKVAADSAKGEAKALELLAAGKQIEAEELLAQEIIRFPEAMKVIELLEADQSEEGQQYFNVHLKEIQAGQRILFLFAAVTRTRFDTDNLQKAFLVFSMVVRMNPATPVGKCAMCLVKLDSQQLRAAEPAKVDEVFAALSKLADDNPDDVAFRWMAGVECRSWNRNAEGAQHYKQLLGKWIPGPAMVHQTYANLLDELQRYDDALAERDIVVKMEPAGWSYDGLGNTLRHLGRFKESNEAHALAVQLHPGYPLYLCNWALCLIDEKRFDEAIQRCKSALVIDAPGENWRPWWIWGTALEGQEKPEEALEKYRKSLSLSPDSPWLKKTVVDLEAKLAK